MANYCPSCGASLDDDAAFCTECGAEIGSGEAMGASASTSDGPAASPGAESGSTASAAGGASPGTSTGSSAAAGASGASAEAGRSDTMFKATAGLVAGYFVFVIGGFAAGSDAVVGLGVICVLVSLVTMYVDLRDLEERLWGTRPILWIVGALLLYIVVAPLYLYKRRQVT